MHKKRIISIAISIALILGVSGCERANHSNQTLYEQGLEVISLMEEMVDSDTYLKIYSASDDMEDIAKNLRTGDYSKPKAIYKVSIAKEYFVEMTNQTVSEETDELSDTLKEYIHSKMSSTIINQINSRGGVMTLAVTSILSGTKTFVSKELTENTIYIYTYENATPVAVSFNVGEDGAILATGNYILYDGFHTGTKQDIKDSFSDMSIMEVKVEDITK